MMDDLEQMIKQKLLEDLIGKMSDQSGERLKPKGMAVEVAAPDKSKLAEGLDKAKDVLGASPGEESSESPSEEEDEQRMLELLGKEDDEDDKSSFGRR